MAKKPTKKIVKKAIRSLTKKQQKIVIILKDALAQINLGVYKSTPGTYVDDRLQQKINKLVEKEYRKEDSNLDTLDTIELKTYLPNLLTTTKTCKVCAKGAVVLSSISKFNNYSLAECYWGGGVNADNASKNILGEENANLMEDCFEGSPVNSTALEMKLDYDDYNKLLDSWSNKYPKAEDRLVAILKNAIKNRGTFKPQQI